MSIINVPIIKVHPNPYQPETRFNVSEEDAKRFGQSILQHGMILTPVGRRTNGFFEIGDGWLRLKGHAWLVDHGHIEYQEMRFDERDLTDQQMADLVLEANKVRKDLNPIEEAQFYARYIKDFKVTEAELATKYNVSQGEVANTMRLLELPENVQKAIISQEISATHGRTLLRVNCKPDLQAKFLQTVSEHHWSVSQLDTEVNRALWQASKPLSTSRHEGPLFPVNDCDKCPTTATVADPWGEQKKQLRCLNIECWDKKQAAAEKLKEAKDKKKLEKKVAGQKVLTGNELHYDSYKHMEDYTQKLDNPAECAKCTKRGLYKYSADSADPPKKVCLDPKCFQAKQTKRTKAENKSKREQEKELTARLGKIFEKVSKNRYGCLVVAARYMLKHIEADVRDDVASMFSDIPKHSNGRMAQDALRARAVNMAEPELIKLLNAMVISQERRKESWQQFSTELKEDVLLDIAILEGTYEAKVAGVQAFQEANCLGCGNANPELVRTGELCCTFTHNREIKDGVCQNSPNKDKLTKGAEAPKKQEEPAGTADAVPAFTVAKRGNSYVASDGKDRVIAIDVTKKDAEAGAMESFKPVATELEPSYGKYLLNHTYRIVPKYGSWKKRELCPDVTAQNLPTAIKALELKPEDVESVKVWKSSGNIGTGGSVSAGWSKCTEPLESDELDAIKPAPDAKLIHALPKQGELESDEQELLSFQFKNCDGCHFAEQAKVGTGKPCCTFITTPHIVDGKCLTRKVETIENHLNAKGVKIEQGKAG